MTDTLPEWLKEQDLEKDAAALPTEEKLSRLADLAIRMRRLENDIEIQEAQLLEAKAKLKQISEDYIPDLMQEIGVEKITLSNGLKLSCKFFASGKVLDDQAYDWFENNGFADLVKCELTVKSRRIEKQDLADVKQLIRDSGFEFTEKDSIHWQTLSAFLREHIEEGKPIPPSNQLEVYRGFRAKIS